MKIFYFTFTMHLPDKIPGDTDVINCYFTTPLFIRIISVGHLTPVSLLAYNHYCHCVTQGCQPYQVPPCLHHVEGEGSCDSQPQEKSHKCVKQCYGDDSIDYNSDHVKSK